MTGNNGTGERRGGYTLYTALTRERKHIPLRLGSLELWLYISPIKMEVPQPYRHPAF